MSQPEHNSEHPPSPRRRTRKLAVVVSVAVVLLVGGGVGIYHLAQERLRPPDQSVAESRRVAERFAHLFESARNEGERGITTPEIRAVLCAEEHDDLVTELAAQRRKEATRTVAPNTGRQIQVTVKDVTVTGEFGTVILTGDQGGRQVDQTFDLVKESGRWKVCGVYRGREPASLPAPGDPTVSRPAHPTR